MELKQKLKNKLIQLDINPDSLSDNEIKILTQIDDAYEEFENTNKDLTSKLAKNKFTKSSVSEKVDCSRQTLYKNPTLVAFLDHCLEKADKISSLLPQDVVSKDKYAQLKKENELILFNVVDNATKDSEIERLSKELKEKNERIDNLVARVEKLNNEIVDLKRKSYN